MEKIVLGAVFTQSEVVVEAFKLKQGGLLAPNEHSTLNRFEVYRFESAEAVITAYLLILKTKLYGFEVVGMGFACILPQDVELKWAVSRFKLAGVIDAPAFEVDNRYLNAWALNRLNISDIELLVPSKPGVSESSCGPNVYVEFMEAGLRSVGFKRVGGLDVPDYSLDFGYQFIPGRGTEEEKLVDYITAKNPHQRITPSTVTNLGTCAEYYLSQGGSIDILRESSDPSKTALKLAFETGDPCCLRAAWLYLRLAALFIGQCAGMQKCALIYVQGNTFSEMESGVLTNEFLSSYRQITGDPESMSLPGVLRVRQSLGPRFGAAFAALFELGLWTK